MAAVLLIALAACTGSGASGAKPRLQVRGETLRGTRFARHERVRVTFRRSSSRLVRRVRTSSAGAFGTPLPAFDACLESVSVVARGSSGDTARLKLPQRACPPAA